MKSSEIRERFLTYFESRGHERVRSSSLIPAADPTLLFTNAGMVQFKDAFLGSAPLNYKRATTAQKCVRAGGKHNDLENVGFTPRHHTFFEMMGNFSFGDYFKKDAIAFAWEFLTKDLGLPKDKLRVTIYKDDDEAMELWKAQGVRPDWIERLGEKDNFWSMGDTGPCGPCTEIHFDWGSQYGNGDSPGTDTTGLRFLEIWNLVFMQFNRDTSGKMEPLPKPSVDTGAGLERLAAVLQGKYTNYDTDLFQPLIQSIASKVGATYGKNQDQDVAMRVIADHLRSGTFLLADGVIPSNEGRGYVLRRILRRAIRYGKKLGQEKPFLFFLVGAVGDSLGKVYPEIISNKKLIETFLIEEEEKFHETLHRGTGILDEAIAKLKKDKQAILPGDIAFRLYDSFGFPSDLIEVMAREHGLTVDMAGFDTLMEKQRSTSGKEKATDKVFLELVTKAIEKASPQTQFLGYETLSADGTALLLFNEAGESVPALKAPATGFAVFDRTPFYAESGGQVGDKGLIHATDGSAQVESTVKVAKVPLHQLKVTSGSLSCGKKLRLEVEPTLRKATMINHTATHMLHAALRTVLGDRVKQAGSLVDPNRLRFDFTYPKAVGPEEILAIEKLVNDEVARGGEVTMNEMPYDEAVKSGALAFFDEKYGDKVRVIRVGDAKKPFSVELCGGTHLDKISDIGFVKVVGESSVASGVRRLEAITGAKALSYMQEREAYYSQVESRLSAKGDQALQKLDQLQQQLKNAQREVEQLKLKVAQSALKGGSSAEPDFETINGLKFLVHQVGESDAKILRALVDQFRDKLKEKAVVAVVGQGGGKVALCVGLTKDVVGKWDAGKIVKAAAPEIGGSGGGRPDFAQAGGTLAEGIPKALDLVRALLKGD